MSSAKKSTDTSKTIFLVNDFSQKTEWELSIDLLGNYQAANLAGVLTACEILRRNQLLILSDKQIKEGIANVISNTNLKGRWQIIRQKPLVVADTGHNPEAFVYISQRLKQFNTGTLHAVLAFSKDKHWQSMLDMLPKTTRLYFSRYNSPRAVKPTELEVYARYAGFDVANVYSNVNAALEDAIAVATENDMIFVGGSTYFIAEIDNL